MPTHHPNRMIIFDDGVGQFGPMSDLRAAFEIRTGMFTTAGRIRVHRPKTLAGYWVPEHLRALVAERADAPVNDLPDEEILFCVNGRWAVPDPDLDLPVGTAIVEQSTGHVVAASLARASAEYFLRTGQLHERIHIEPRSRRMLYKYPWDVIGLLKDTIEHDILSVRLLDVQVATNVAEIVGSGPVEVHSSAVIGPRVVFDTEQGPIIIHEHAIVRPGSVLCGPCSVGAGATVVDRALIRPNTVIGPRCKVGGEVGGTIFQGYANKSHDGFLGDSWVGKWVNLGAGTTGSNLLNTYGEIAMRSEVDGPRHRTGLRFLGAVIGDHVKTAIGTRIMTGSVLGTGAMVALSTPPPDTVRRFAWLTDKGERSYRLGKFLEVMNAVMARRDRTPSRAYAAAVEALYRFSEGSSGTSNGEG